MANTLTARAKTDIQKVIADLVAENGLEKPNLAESQIELLSRNYAAYGYTAQIQFLEDLKERPVWTLLSLVIYLS